MIDDELTFQAKNWYQIVPNVEYGSLPTTGDMIVELEGYDNFNGKDRPHFKIDGSKAIEMLQGAGMYNDPTQSIRELLQNAVDATYLRIFKENPKRELADFQKECEDKRFQLHISLKKHSCMDDDYSHWSFILEDSGIGMSKEDLSFLYNTGSSNKNSCKKKIVEAMPSELRPSGTFGIGFQSVFLITDEVEMTTHRLGREDTLKLKLHNPSGQQKGNILLTTIAKDEDAHIGTRLKFNIKMKRRSGWSINMNDHASMSIINDYDFARDPSLDVMAGKIIDEIAKFSTHSPIKLCLDFNGEIISLDKPKDSRFDYYDEETGLQVMIGNYDALFFRNQVVKNYQLRSFLFDFNINILKGDAKDILTLNRNDIRSEYADKLRTDIGLATCRYLIKEFDGFDEDKKQYAAAYLTLNENFLQSHGISLKKTMLNDWENILIKGKADDDDCEKKIRELLEYDKIIAGHYGKPTSNAALMFYQEGENNPSFIAINSGIRHTTHELYQFLCKILYKKIPGIQYSTVGISLSKNVEGQYIASDKESRQKWLRRYKTGRWYARGCMPCDNKYKMLAVEYCSDSTFGDFSNDYPQMVCPYIRKHFDSGLSSHAQELEYLVDDKVINFVFENRCDESVTKEQIQQAYQQFESDWNEAFESIKNADSKQ
jgi:hypothetical protein